MTIAHRFALRAPGGWHVPGATSWNAHDTRLDAPVVVLVADSGNADAILAALTRARGVRDPRLARVVDVGIADIPKSDDDAADARRAYVAVAIPPEPTAASILETRVLPVLLARLLIGGAAEALNAASAAGLAHGSLSPDAIGVTSRGRVIVAGAGLLGAFGGDAQSAGASDAQTLATVFVRAVLGVDVDEAGDAALPKDLTKSERRLVTRTLRGEFPTSVAALLADLGSADGATLSAIRTQMRKLERIVPLAPEEPEFEGPSVEMARGVDALSAGATQEEIDEWELEQLLEEEEVVELPTLTEAILDLLHRRFPQSARITNYLEAAHARALRGARINGSLWTVVGLLALVTVLAIVATNVFRAPFVPTFDLNNPPPQSYPTFSFAPPPTDVPPAP